MGTTTPAAVADAVLKAIVDDKVEIAVAPLLDRVAAHVGLVSPTLSVRAQSGSVGQTAAAAGHRAATPRTSVERLASATSSSPPRKNRS